MSAAWQVGTGLSMSQLILPMLQITFGGQMTPLKLRQTFFNPMNTLPTACLATGQLTMSKRLLEMARSISPSHLTLAALVLWTTFAGMTLASCTNKLVMAPWTTYLSGQTQCFTSLPQ